MEELLERLVIAVEQQNSAFPWDNVISILALIASWITIFFLLKERSEKNRPYMQISFELVRSTLACVVLRNVGTVPLEVNSLTFNETFTKQLQTKTQERLKRKESTSIVIFPGQKWIISFDTNVFNIINEFNEKYQSDGIIWYFDNCEESLENVIRHLWKLNELGYFKYAKAIIFGRFGVVTSNLGLTIKEALNQSVITKLNIPIIYDANISHKGPCLNIINGSIATINFKDNKGTIKFEIK